MNVKKIEENYMGTKMTVVTKSGNKIMGEIVKSDGDGEMLKLKTDSGIITVNVNAIESIY